MNIPTHKVPVLTREQANNLQSVIEWLREGKTVQVLHDERWVNFQDWYYFHPDYKYRIKPSYPKDIWCVILHPDNPNGMFSTGNYTWYDVFPLTYKNSSAIILHYTLSQDCETSQ